MLEFFEKLLATVGRILLGLYFLVPGFMKILDFEGTGQSMLDKGMMFVPFFLVLTIIIQVGGGLSMMIGYKTQMIAFVLAGLTLVINIVMHDFWDMEAGLQQAHDTQNFIKNLAIMAGLLVVAGLGAGPWSADERKANAPIV